MNKTVLFGLKDENGIEYKLILPDPVSVNTQVFAQAIPNENKPEFKAGQWAGFRTYDGKIFPFLIHHFNGRMVYGQSFQNKYDIYKIVYQTDKHNLISVTPEEIKSYLRKICDEKYIGKKVKCLVEEEDEKIIECFKEYRYNEDCMIYTDEAGINMFVYEQGKFASIIEDKKKLPKTKDEGKKFLDDFLSKLPDDIIVLIDVDDFLDQYEI